MYIAQFVHIVGISGKISSAAQYSNTPCGVTGIKSPCTLEKLMSLGLELLLMDSIEIVLLLLQLICIIVWDFICLDLLTLELLLIIIPSSTELLLR